ncbi:adenylate kinase family protein [Blochmannia endosymbiont of Camponotus (Colobopsis) obliquus]|uniref:adenylate kinase family protein n=1 Tax=Blochmannia endosymbiont of Camponotus (Colobopsis) obliquus TaxID=1505597 RepID=UPI00061A75C1|nr:nucleoside monophosphate kinase [Blochmannia endosymbiont of Camponotus (Colobopsis) obliquus]AKC60469.1 adenylate kinase [Blochmannia endosymbiont of Camponotus (Colobopsis) obliquus]
MRIVLLGPPGSGKGTQSEFLANRYNIPQISIGKILRNIIQKKLYFSTSIKKFMESGELVPDHLVIDIINNYICQYNYYEKFVLDGFPRTLYQALTMKNKGIIVDVVVELVLSDASVIERIVGRRTHISSGRIYHIKFNPPKDDNYDDYTGEKLIIREDDQEDIAFKRLESYRKNTLPVIKYYSQEAQAGNLHYFSINGGCKISDIHRKLIKIIDACN